MAASSVGFNYTPFGAASGRRRLPHGVTGELLKGVGGEPFDFQGFGGCDEVGIYFGFHYLNRASIARRSLQLPEGKRGKSSFDEVRCTLSMGGDVDAF